MYPFPYSGGTAHGASRSREIYKPRETSAPDKGVRLNEGGSDLHMTAVRSKSVGSAVRMTIRGL